MAVGVSKASPATPVAQPLPIVSAEAAGKNGGPRGSIASVVRTSFLGDHRADEGALTCATIWLLGNVGHPFRLSCRRMRPWLHGNS